MKKRFHALASEVVTIGTHEEKFAIQMHAMSIGTQKHDGTGAAIPIC